MAKRKTNTIKIEDAVESLTEAKNLTQEYIYELLKSTICKAFIKVFLSGGDDAIVRCEIEKENKENTFVIYYGKKVQEEEQIVDDYLEISSDDEKVKELGLKIGDLYEKRILLSDLLLTNKAQKFISSFSTSFKSKIIEAEKNALLEVYGSKIGDLITCNVSQYNKDTREAFVELSKNTEVPLQPKDQIGDETFKVGEQIKVCIINVESSSKGAGIHVSRSHPLFLKRLFEQEIHEVYDGTVIIKNIARRAGERSKVAVYSNDPNVDPCGTCIGKAGDRIVQVTKNFGNSKDKEKIDVVLYDENPAVYIAEALVPAHVVGLTFIKRKNEDTNEIEDIALAVVKDGELSTAIGKKGCNVYLAAKLTGFKIEIKEHEEILKEGIPFKTMEAIKEEDRIAKLNKQVNIETQVENKEVIQKEVPVSETFSEEKVQKQVLENKKEENEVLVSQEPIEETKIEVQKEIKTEQKPNKPSINVDTIKMEDLLTKLENEKKDEELQKKKKDRKYSKKKEESKEEESKEESKKPIKTMAIYTDEELEELKREEEEEESYGVDEDDDYDEYDSDSYYEDN